MTNALVVGAGPAGLLAALALSQRGITVHLADPAPGDGARTRPQWNHVHRYPAVVWQRLKTWCPEIEGVPGPWLERQLLDQSLWRLCQPHVAHTHACRINALAFRAGRVCVQIQARALWFDVIVDASGAARGTVASVAEASGASLQLHEAPPGGSCVSASLSGVGQPDAGPFLACRHVNTGSGAILVRGAKAVARLTLQLPCGASAPADMSEIHAFLADLPDPRLAMAVAGARLQGRPVRFAGRPSSRLALEAMSRLPANWIPLGDCLLTTPPWLGQGIDQITEQVALMASGLDAGQSWAELRAGMAARARERWWGATWVEALRTSAHAGQHRSAVRHATSEDFYSARASIR